MPTHEETSHFKRDFEALSLENQRRFREAVRQFVEDLRAHRPFRGGLGVKRVQGTAHTFEMRWAGDGRATFQYGEEVQPGEHHIIWRRCGTHDVFRSP